MIFDGLTTGEIVREQSDTDYHSVLDHVGSTSIKAGYSSRSPAAVWESMNGGTSISASAASVGHATHCAVLTPHLFEAGFGIGPTKTRRAKAWAEAESETDAVLLTAEEMDNVCAMRDAVFAHIEARDLIESCTDYELSCYAVDDGVRVKARLDGYTAGTALDLKTTSSGVDPASFASSCERYGYHIQDAHYMACGRLCGLVIDTFRFVALSKSAPHRVAVYTLSPDDVQLGMDIRSAVLRDYRAWLERTEGIDREQTLREHGYGGGVIRLPRWAKTKFEQYMEAT